MSSFHSVVTEQKVFICAVCSFIGKLLRAVLPDIAWDSRYLQSEEELSASLDGVIQKFAGGDSDAGDCQLAMAQFACRKMKRVCDMLKRISASVGLQEVAARYLDAIWFVDMLFRMDVSKLNKLLYMTDFTDEKPSRILMNVAAILEGREDGYDAMSARAKRKADRETKALIEKVGEDVKSLHGKMDAHDAETKKQFAAVRSELHETKEELLARADAILRKSGKMNSGGKRKGKHTTEQKKICLALWMEAQNNETLKSGTNTGKPTHDAAFQYYRRELSMVGVESVAKFKSVIHTVQSTKSAESIKALEAKREAERKRKAVSRQSAAASASRNTSPRKCGIIRGNENGGGKIACGGVCGAWRGGVRGGDAAVAGAGVRRHGGVHERALRGAAFRRSGA